MKQAKASKIAGRPRNRAAGFTLIELLITITIVGILAAVALPSFRSFVAQQRIKTASFDLMSMLTLARSEAIKRNANVSFGGLGTGNLVIAVVDSGTVIQQREPFAGLTLTCKDTGGATVACADVVYLGSGRLQSAPPSMEISSAASNQMRCISIDLSGRPASKKAACS